MATLENIRKRGKLLAIVIGLALLAFILGDIINSGQALFNGQKLDVVTVNGSGVNIQDFEREVSNTEAFYQLMQQTSSLSSEASQQIRSSVWETTVREALLAESYDELGLEISEDEMKDLFIGKNVHPMVKQILADPNTGQYNKTFVQNIYQNFEQISQQDPQKAEQLRIILKYTEDYIKKDRAYTKYIGLVTKGMYVNNLEVEDDNISKKYMVNLDLVGKRVNPKDSSVVASEKELNDYYKKHLALFKATTETRDISYITFDVFPSAADSLLAKQSAQKFKDELQASNDEQSVVNYKSAKPQLVKFYTADELKDSALFNSEANKTYGPYLELGMYNVAKVIETQQRPDTVSVRHILVSPQNPNIASMTRAEIVADSLIDVLNNGGDFAQLCKTFSDDPGSKDKGGVYEDVVEGTMVPEFNDYCFETEVGKIGRVTTQFGVHIIEVTEIKNVVPKTKVAFIQVEINPTQATFDSVYAKAMKVRGMSLDKEGFEKVIQEEQFVRREAPGLTQASFSIPGLDASKDIVNWSFKAEENEVSSVFEITNKYVIALLNKKNEVGYLPLDKVKAQVENSVLQKKRVEKLYNESFANQNVTDLGAFASKIGEKEVNVPNVVFNSFQVSSFGYEPAILGAINKLEKDKVFGPIKGKNGVFFVKATSITQAPELTGEELVKQQQALQQSKLQMASRQAYVALKNAAEIIDRRANFY